MSGDDELQHRLRANRGRLWRHRYVASVERALGIRISLDEFLAIDATDRLADSVAERIRSHRPDATWPKSERPAVFGYLADVADIVASSHRSYLAYFEGWKELGALRVPSAAACRHVASLWSEGAEAFSLITPDLFDGLYLDYTEPDQLMDEDEYELWSWGAFARS